VTPADLPLIVAMVVIVLLSAVGTWGLVLVHRRNYDWAAEPAPVPARPLPPPQPRRGKAFVVVNPTKHEDVDRLREELEKVAVAHGWAPPRWLETTVEDTGRGQAIMALASGADLVLACGGDGTVRAVAEGMAGSGVPMGLLPAGTGNLLARNLDVDLTGIVESAHAAFTGRDQPIDVGRLTMSGPDGSQSQHVFCVMAGLGFDAAVMAGAPEALKAKVGWFAYVVAGVRNLGGASSRVRLRVDGGPVLERRVRTVVVGNCGRLTGGLVLMPDAEVDDGWLDVVSIAPQGLGGWLGVALRVLSQRRRGHPRVEHFRATTVDLTTESPEQVQVDGDPVGTATAVRMQVQPGALLLRVPQGTAG
jgi:diacylglycerol kinase (ATP)